MSDSIKKYKEMLEDGLIEPSNPLEENYVLQQKNKNKVMNRETHHEKCLKVAEEFLKGWGVDDPTAIRMVASIMMHRDGNWQGGGFVEAVCENDLYAAITRADNTSLKYLKLYTIAKRNCFTR